MRRSIVTSALVAASLAIPLVAQTPSASAPARSAPAPARLAPAPTPVLSEPGKIAVIAFNEAVGQTNEFQRAFADLQKKWEPKRQELKKLNDDIEASTKALNAQGTTLSDAERANRAKTIDDKKKQLERQGEDAQNDFQQELQTIFSQTASKVYDVLSNYAQQNSYTLVLNVADQQTPILYAIPTTDITKIIVDAYNVKSGVPAPPPSAPSPAGIIPGTPQAPKTPPPAPKGPGQ